MIQELTEFLSVDRKGSKSFYIKRPMEGKFIRRPRKELEAYGVLGEYFQMPRARIACLEDEEVLVVQGIQEESADKLLVSQPEVVGQTLSDFVDENIRMWKQTVKPMDETKLSRNWREETLNTAIRLKHDPKFEEVAGKELTINGIDYPSLGSTLERTLHRLSQGPERSMCLVHGDEHLANLIPVSDGHFTIDPGNWTGLNTPSSAYNNILGANHLFFFLPYEGKAVANNGNYKIDYQLKEKFTPAEQSMAPAVRKLDTAITDIQGPDNFSRDFLFVNCLRCAVGWVQRSMDLDQVLKTGFIYAGIATEKYYENSF